MKVTYDDIIIQVLTLSCAVREAPWLSKYVTTSKWPLKEAACRAVEPYLYENMISWWFYLLFHCFIYTCIHVRVDIYMLRTYYITINIIMEKYIYIFMVMYTYIYRYGCYVYIYIVTYIYSYLFTHVWYDKIFLYYIPCIIYDISTHIIEII